MSRKHNLVDGFIPRQSSDKLGGLHRVEQRSLGARQADQKIMYTKDNNKAIKLQSTKSRRTLGRADIDESLSMIDKNPIEDSTAKKQRKTKRKSGIRPKKSLVKRIFKWVSVTLLVAILGLGIYTGVKFLIAGSNIFQGSFFDLMRNEPLKQDENGRTNILIFGMSPDERKEDPYLTDSMILLSINQETKDAFMVSFPRDIWVAYDEPCVVGYQGKLNATYLCGSSQGRDHKAGVEALKSKISDISGLDIQYHTSVNWGVLTRVVNALGGIDVDLPDSINDSMTKLRLPSGRSHLDGEQALALARSRYGVEGGDFGRGLNQQRVIRAILEKASSTGTLTNLGKVTSLVDALGDNLRTDIEMKEVRTLMDVASGVDVASVESVNLTDPDDPLLITGNYNGQSIVNPTAGMMDFSEIRQLIKKRVSQDPVVVESAKIAVYNGSDTYGLAKREADKLTESGYSIASIGNAPSGDYAAVEVYRVVDGLPATSTGLREYFGVEIQTGDVPIAPESGTDFIVILGDPS